MNNEDNRAARVVFLTEQLAAARRALLDEGDFTPKERTYRLAADVACATWYVEREEGEITTLTIQPANDPPFSARGSAAPVGDWTALADHRQQRIWLLRNSMRVERGDPRADVMARQAEEESPIARLLESGREAERCRTRAMDRFVARLDSERAATLARYWLDTVCESLPWSIGHSMDVEYVTLYGHHGVRRVAPSNLLTVGQWSVFVSHGDSTLALLRNEFRVEPGDERRIQQILAGHNTEGSDHGG